MPEVIHKVMELLEKEHDVIALYLFGSRARGDYGKKSDYDFFVVLDRNTKNPQREDELYKITRKIDLRVHLTFQYLFIAYEHKSLLLKISSEGRLLFSRAFLLGSYEQMGLQKYYLCSWESKDISKRQLIHRLLRGYRGSKGMVDGLGIIGDKGQILVLDTMLYHLLESFHVYSVRLSIMQTVYVPREKLPSLQPYKIKQQVENQLEREKGKRVDVLSIKEASKTSMRVRYRIGKKTEFVKMKTFADWDLIKHPLVFE